MSKADFDIDDNWGDDEDWFVPENKKTSTKAEVKNEVKQEDGEKYFPVLDDDFDGFDDFEEFTGKGIRSIGFTQNAPKKKLRKETPSMETREVIPEVVPIQKEVIVPPKPAKESFGEAKQQVPEVAKPPVSISVPKQSASKQAPAAPNDETDLKERLKSAQKATSVKPELYDRSVATSPDESSVLERMKKKANEPRQEAIVAKKHNNSELEHHNRIIKETTAYNNTNKENESRYVVLPSALELVFQSRERLWQEKALGEESLQSESRVSEQEDKKKGFLGLFQTKRDKNKNIRRNF